MITCDAFPSFIHFLNTSVKPLVLIFSHFSLSFSLSLYKGFCCCCCVHRCEYYRRVDGWFIHGDAVAVTAAAAAGAWWIGRVEADVRRWLNATYRPTDPPTNRSGADSKQRRRRRLTRPKPNKNKTNEELRLFFYLKFEIINKTNKEEDGGGSSSSSRSYTTTPPLKAPNAWANGLEPLEHLYR